jgi:hypothetical protein
MDGNFVKNNLKPGDMFFWHDPKNDDVCGYYYIETIKVEGEMVEITTTKGYTIKTLACNLT